MKTSEAAAIYERLGKPAPLDIAAPAPEKVRNTRRKVVNGVEFRSTLEADCYQLLRLWEQAGLIQDLRIQPLFVLQPKMKRDGKVIRAITYTADFMFIRDGITVVIDAKGFAMPVYRMKLKMFKALYPNVQFQEWNKETLRSLS